MKSTTLALIISLDAKSGLPQLHHSLTDEHEIAIVEAALIQGEAEPMEFVLDYRQRQKREEEEFANYVEDLLSQPFVRAEVQEHGLQWLRSRMRIEKFQRHEAEAAQIIADYAWKVFLENPARTDFMLAGPHAKVRIRVLTRTTPAASAASPGRLGGAQVA